MKFFPKKLSLKWINQAYDNNELTPYELVDEILKRAEEQEYLDSCSVKRAYGKVYLKTSAEK